MTVFECITMIIENRIFNFYYISGPKFLYSVVHYASFQCLHLPVKYNVTLHLPYIITVFTCLDFWIAAEPFSDDVQSLMYVKINYRNVRQSFKCSAHAIVFLESWIWFCVPKSLSSLNRNLL